jgi:hypothetical protein
VQREHEEEQLPDVPPAPNAEKQVEVEQGSEQELRNELQLVKTQLAEMAANVETMKRKAEEADKETKSRSVDPLRQQAEAVALEVASGGESLRKPPPKVDVPKPEPEMSLSDLRQRTRDEILRHLSGDIA